MRRIELALFDDLNAARSAFEGAAAHFASVAAKDCKHTRFDAIPEAQQARRIAYERLIWAEKRWEDFAAGFIVPFDLPPSDG